MSVTTAPSGADRRPRRFGGVNRLPAIRRGVQEVRERLDENLGSANLDLTSQDLAELAQASASVQIQGDRSPEAMQKMIDR